MNPSKEILDRIAKLSEGISSGLEFDLCQSPQKKKEGIIDDHEKKD